MKRSVAMLGAATALALALPVGAAEVPGSVDAVARPGGDLPGDPKIALVKLADGFNDPINVTNAGDGSGRIFVVERVGRVKVVDRDGNVQAEPFLDLTTINPLGNDVQTGFVEQGLYAIAFHPDFAENGYFYVHYASLPFNGDGMIVRFQVDPASPDVVNADRANETAKVIMRIEQPWYNHNGGQIEFGPDGYLYIGSGDGGWEGDPYEAGQDLSTWLGKILRIDVDVPEDDGRPYAIPRRQPVRRRRRRAADGAVRHHRGGVRDDQDPLQAGDLGLWRAQSLRVQLRSGDRRPVHRRRRPEPLGGDHLPAGRRAPAARTTAGRGWRPSKCHPMLGDPAAQQCPVIGVLPAAEYPHQVPYPGAAELTDDWGCSAQGLGVANYGGMQGVYLVGDWCSGRVFGLGWDGSAWQLEELAQTDLQFTAGGYDEDGNVLAVNCNCFYIGEQGALANPPGALWRVVPADQVPQGAEVARTVQ